MHPTRRTLCFSLLLALLPPLEAGQARRAERTPNPIAPDRTNLSYGPHRNNVLDLWLAKSATPTPLVVFIHGGGFVGGDKGSANPAFVRRTLASGVSYAAINYRFRGDAPIQDVLRDCTRAIQYLRYRAREFNIDKSRVAAMGGSAGAGTSLWLAFHDDLADPANPDPVLRESSRISAATATATQATYDILRWKEFLGDAAAQAGGSVDGAAFYGLKTMEELTSDEGRRIRADVDMLGLVTKDDPPVLLISSSQHDALQTKGAVVHSARHAAAVKKRCDEVGVSATVKIVAGLNDAQSGVNPLEFLLQRLGVQPQ
jgi:acetyl esterase/lipase